MDLKTPVPSFYKTVCHTPQLCVGRAVVGCDIDRWVGRHRNSPATYVNIYVPLPLHQAWLGLFWPKKIRRFGGDVIVQELRPQGAETRDIPRGPRHVLAKNPDVPKVLMESTPINR